jgi:cell division protein FtsB
MGGKLLIVKRSFSRVNNNPVKCKRTVKRRGKNVMIINEKCSSKRSKRGSKRKKRKCKNCGKMYHGGGNHRHKGGRGSGGGYGLKGGGVRRLIGGGGNDSEITLTEDERDALHQNPDILEAKQIIKDNNIKDMNDVNKLAARNKHDHQKFHKGLKVAGKILKYSIEGVAFLGLLATMTDSKGNMDPVDYYILTDNSTDVRRTQNAIKNQTKIIEKQQQQIDQLSKGNKTVKSTDDNLQSGG